MLRRYAGVDLLCIHVVSVFWINWKLVGWVVEDRKRIERLEEENRVMRREMERIREN